MADKKKKYRSLKSIPFGGNALRLSLKELLIVVPITLVIAFFLIPVSFEKWEEFNFDEPEFRIGYDFRDDYWSYRKWCEYTAEHFDTLFVGDSVIWGMYTDNAHTLSAHYNHLSKDKKSANLGIDGLHPVALEGLMRDFGSSLRDKKIYLYFNALWMNDPKFDLSAMPQKDKDGELETISVMHPRLVPQFDSTLYCYVEQFKKRVSISLERNIPMYSMLNHLRGTWYNNTPFPQWMNNNPQKQLFSPVMRNVDAVEHEHINRTDAWNKQRGFEVSYNWVMPYRSRQWEAFINTVKLLESRGNDVVVLMGAFNTHLLTEESLEEYYSLMEIATEQLDELNIKYISMDELPIDAYADASHPLDPGYKIMAEQIIEKEEE